MDLSHNQVMLWTYAGLNRLREHMCLAYNLKKLAHLTQVISIIQEHSLLPCPCSFGLGVIKGLWIVIEGKLVLMPSEVPSNS